MDTPLLTIQGLCKHYGEGFSLEDVGLTVAAGSVTGFIGANGAGKTTTIRAALGLMPINSGRVVAFGEEITHASNARCAKRLKERIGIVFDTCPFLGHQSVKAVGSLMRRAYPTWSQALFEDYLRRFNLDPKQKVSKLSRGMGMKLQLACALAHTPELLILDEATAGLDPLAREEVLGMLRDYLTDERGILISSHITSDLEKIADRIVCIDQGRIAFDVEKDAITETAGIARCRACEYEAVAACEELPQEKLHVAQHLYGVDVLVPNRFAFARLFPAIPCDKASIEEYMQIYLKGSTR